MNGDYELFEYLLEKGASTSADIIQPRDLATMYEFRETWMHIVVKLQMPLVAIRFMHEYLCGYNWSSILQTIQDIANRV